MSFSIKPGHEDDIYTPLAEMNVTPFIDVMLVLLVIFMVTAPMLATGMNVELPQTRMAQPLEPQEPIIVSIGSDGKAFVNAEEVVRAELPARVKQLAGDTMRAVHIKGDRAAAYADVVGVLDDLATAGITRLSIITRTKETRARAAE
jgi:biopolymer transport protein ExbD/biopolymer transport protein TolR